MEYEILGADDIKNLETVVRDAIADGWEPLGGVSVSSHYRSYVDRDGFTEGESNYTFVQAMVKRK
jgi:hypothetical protein